MSDRCYRIFSACLLGWALAGCATEGVLQVPTPSWERMIVQPKVDPYEPGSLRHPPDGTVPYLAEPLPTRPPLSQALLTRGQERYGVFCQPCHGVLGTAATPIAERMSLVRPRNLHLASVREAPDDTLFQVVREGYGLMPSYGAVLPPEDAWAVVAYVRALQLSSEVQLDALPPAWQSAARRALPPPPVGGAP